MPTSIWHQGPLNQEDQLFRRARPHCAELERRVAAAVRGHERGRTLRVLELGCGTGFQTAAILRLRPDLKITALDHDAKQVAQAKRNLRPWSKSLTFVRSDVLSHLRRVPAGSFDAVASKFTLHNLERSYRSKVMREILRVLAPGGLFVNGDKYALEGRAQTAALRAQMLRYLDVFLPLGRRDLMRDTINHYMDDEGEAYVLRERAAVREMRSLGFLSIRRTYRRGMDAVFTAVKPR